MSLATPTEARVHWADAPQDDARLQSLLDVATDQVLEYAPVLAEGAAVPERYKLATIYQAREVYAAAVRTEADVVGVGDFVIRARPLTASVMQLLRPQSGRWVVG